MTKMFHTWRIYFRIFMTWLCASTLIMCIVPNSCAIHVTTGVAIIKKLRNVSTATNHIIRAACAKHAIINGITRTRSYLENKRTQKLRKWISKRKVEIKKISKKMMTQSNSRYFTNWQWFSLAIFIQCNNIKLKSWIHICHNLNLECYIIQ